MQVRSLLLTLAALLGSFAHAQTEPARDEGFLTSGSSLYRLSDWLEAQDGTFHSPLDRCVLRSDRSSRAYPLLTAVDAAARAALTLQKNLEAQQLQNVQVEVLPRPDQFALLAIYDYLAEERPHRARQLFLSEGGQLRTVTGSSVVGEPDPCVLEMVRFLRQSAY